MLPSRFAGIALLILLWLPSSAFAQRAPDRIVLMTQYEVNLQDEDRFREYLLQRVQAATVARLGPERGWVVLRGDNTWLVIQPIQSLAAVGHGDFLAAQLSGTAGEATLRSAQAKLAEVDFTALSRVIAAPASMRHSPATSAPGNFAFVQEFRVAPGAERNSEEFVTFLGEIDLPYRYEAYLPVIGPELVVGIVWPDDLVRYYSEFSPVVLAQRYPARFGPLSQRLRSGRRDMNTRLYSVQHPYSYPPTAR